MKKLLAFLAVWLIASATADAQSLSDILRGLGNRSDTTATTSSGSASGLGGTLSGLANALGIGSKELTAKDLAGTWKYVGPAVSFKSDNFLLKAGGAAAAQQVESRIAPYYKRAGLTSLVITLAEDSTFTFKARSAKLSGQYYRSAETGNYVFVFKAFKTVNIGAMEAFILMNGGKMELTFDVSRLMTLVERVGAITGSSSVKTLSDLLNNYDGITAGFELKRE